MKLASLLALALVVAAPQVHADSVTRHVPADYPTIQQALNASGFGDIVLVAPGTYFENIVMSSQHDGVRLLSESGPEVTTIDAGQVDRVFRCSDVGSETQIVGFTLINGRAEPFTPNNIGGGLSLYDADLLIQNNIIRDNFAEAAGGLYINYSSPTLLSNVIRDNEALGSGGGIYCDHYSAPRLERNIIARNRSGHYGGGVTIWETSSPQLINNTIVSNTASLNGGGVYVTRSSHPALTGNIIADSQGNGMHLADASSSVSMGCNDVWGNSPANYAGLPDGTGINGNISDDPRFCDLANFDLRIDESSPCAAPNSPPGCGLIGALGVGCGPIAVESTTWGGIKARYGETITKGIAASTPH